MYNITCRNLMFEYPPLLNISNYTLSVLFGSLGIAVEKGICGGCLRAKPANNPHIWPLPRQIPERLLFPHSRIMQEAFPEEKDREL